MAHKGIDFVVNDEGISGLTAPEPSDPAGLHQPGMKGARRAARLLLALGAEQAAVILREMDQSDIESLVNEMARIKSISAAERKAILADFNSQIEGFELPVRGGMDQAREFLRHGLGEAEAEEIMSRIDRRDLKHDFEFLEQVEPPLLASALTQEHPQTAAVALSYIRPKIAAAVLKHLAEDFRADVAKRIAMTARTHPDAVERVARVLREKFERRTEEVYSETGGASALADILNHMDRDTEEDIMHNLDKSEPSLYRDVKERLYTFEELSNLDIKEMRVLLSAINDDYIVAAALRGAPDDLRRFFFNGMSQNRAADILEEMQLRGPISVREINEARTFVLNVARKLDDEGNVVIKKQKEEYI